MRSLPRRDAEPPSLLEGIIRRLRDLAGVPEAEGTLRQTIDELIEESDADEARTLSPEEKTLLVNAMSFGELRVDDVMIPRSDIRGVPVTASLTETVKAMRDARHTRLIVYGTNLDDVLGIVHIKDILDFWGDGGEFVLEAVVRPVLIVPPSMRVVELLLEMRANHRHLAVVVDEFGGTDGLVTVEDLVTELVGDVGDEHGRPVAARLVDRPDGSLDVDGRLDLEDLEAHLGVTLLGEDERDEADTVAGLIFALLERIPARGEKVEHPTGMIFEVLEADPRRIKRVRVHRPKSEAAPEDVASA